MKVFPLEYFIIHIWYTVNPAWLQPSTREPQWFHYFNLTFLELLHVITWLVFQNKVKLFGCVSIGQFLLLHCFVT